MTWAWRCRTEAPPWGGGGRGRGGRSVCKSLNVDLMHGQEELPSEMPSEIMVKKHLFFHSL